MEQFKMEGKNPFDKAIAIHSGGENRKSKNRKMAEADDKPKKALTISS